MRAPRRLDVRERLFRACEEHDLMSAREAERLAGLDLVDSGVVDSMGLVSLQAAVEGEFGVRIPEAVFVAELRTLDAVAAHLADRARGDGR